MPGAARRAVHPSPNLAKGPRNGSLIRWDHMFGERQDHPGCGLCVDSFAARQASGPEPLKGAGPLACKLMTPTRQCSPLGKWSLVGTIT